MASNHKRKKTKPMGSIKNDRWIRAQEGMIVPIVERKKAAGQISYGVDSYGYDVRIKPQYARPSSRLQVIDPKGENPMDITTTGDGRITIPPGDFIQVETVERFKIPDNVQVFAFPKSTYAKLSIQVNICPTEPGYEGSLTLSVTNPTKYPMVVYANEGIAALKFIEADEVCEENYVQLGGKYQGSEGITTSKV